MVQETQARYGDRIKEEAHFPAKKKSLLNSIIKEKFTTENPQQGQKLSIRPVSPLETFGFPILLAFFLNIKW